MTRCSTLLKRVGSYTTRPGGLSGHFKWLPYQEDLGLTMQRSRQQFLAGFLRLLCGKKKKTRERVGVFVSQPLFLICSSCISKVTLGPRFTVISWTRFLVPRDFTFLQRRPMKRAVMHLSLARLRRGPLWPSPYYYPTNALYANQTVFKMFAILLTC